jgi:hypothetical protein
LQTTVGRVHQITWNDDAASVCVRVGPSADDVEALLVLLDGPANGIAYKNCLIEALGRALMSGQTIVATHGSEDAVILGLMTE